MLELSKILRDIDELGRERAGLFSSLGDELAKAADVMSDMGKDPLAAGRRIRDAQTSWLVATCDEPPTSVYELPEISSQHAVVAVDGSQIMPDKHEVTLCYLLNAAGVILYYGTGERPVSETFPQLCYREEDMFEEAYGGRRVPINEKLVGMRRTLSESAEMERLIQAAAASGVPTVALWDGSLIQWSLQNEPPDYKERILGEYLRVFEEARRLRIPIAGYISDPGSKDFVNSMRIMLCDQDPVNCDRCRYKDTDEAPPCDAMARLKDTIVYKKRLQGGRRSVIFTSDSTILKHYGEHEIRAFYMDAGQETVRIEIPKWVAEDRQLLDLTHAVCRDQAQKGRGYPVALSEAHEHAVVRGADRTAFFRMVEQAFVKHGAPITQSQKRISKGY